MLLTQTVLGIEHVLLSLSHWVKFSHGIVVSAQSPLALIVMKRHWQLVFVEHGKIDAGQLGKGQHPQPNGVKLIVI